MSQFSLAQQYVSIYSSARPIGRMGVLWVVATATQPHSSIMRVLRCDDWASRFVSHTWRTMLLHVIREYMCLSPPVATTRYILWRVTCSTRRAARSFAETLQPHQMCTLWICRQLVRVTSHAVYGLCMPIYVQYIYIYIKQVGLYWLRTLTYWKHQQFKTRGQIKKIKEKRTWHWGNKLFIVYCLQFQKKSKLDWQCYIVHRKPVSAKNAMIAHPPGN